ncbi:MAG: hypothetical protein BWY32_02317 [bacterium ADurb.Bin243]|nr:MAG: hypothetical protein BWY32_02317 [bacterium ADurb.Bin243]
MVIIEAVPRSGCFNTSRLSGSSNIMNGRIPDEKLCTLP